MASTYTQLCPVLYGDDALEVMGKKIADEGKKKAYIFCDQGVKASGASGLLEDILKKNGVESWIFDGCIPDAPDTFVDQCARAMKDHDPDIIIGIGGGSSMDTAKAAGVAYDMNDSICRFMEENGNPGFTIKTPVYVIPTASGTGSECTPMCVIHEESSDTKKVVLRPAELAVLQPSLTVTCPPAVTVNSGMDAFSHAVESLTSVESNPMDMLLARQAIKLIWENLPKVIADPEDLEARGHMLFASNIAGISFATQSVHIGHCLAHEAGVHFHMNHGQLCGLSVPETIMYCAEAKHEEVHMIAEQIGVDVNGLEPIDAAKKVADTIRQFMRDCGLKSFKEMGIDREALIAIKKDAIDHNWFHVMCPGDVSYDQMGDYLAAAYDNYQ